MPPPEDRPEQSAAVQGRRGDEIEHGQHEVDQGKPCEHPDHQLGHPGKAQEDRYGEKGGGDDHADQRPHGGDSQLGTGIRCVAGEARDAAEQPQRDALDGDPVAAGDDRVREFVGQQGQEEDRTGCQATDGVGNRRCTGVQEREAAGRQPERDQAEDNQHAPVDPDVDAGNPSES